VAWIHNHNTNTNNTKHNSTSVKLFPMGINFSNFIKRLKNDARSQAASVHHFLALGWAEDGDSFQQPIEARREGKR